MPLRTGVPVGRSPRITPEIEARINSPSTTAIGSPFSTRSPIWRISVNTPSFGARSTRSVVKPLILPGMPVFGSAAPSRMTRPRSCPRIVSITAWQSTPAVKPGPRAITIDASVISVPKFRFARIASTTTSGRSALIHSASGSASMAMWFLSWIKGISFMSDVYSAVTSSTVNAPFKIASEKHTVLRIEVGWGRSVITIRKPQCARRTATPLARSPAPLITIIFLPPICFDGLLRL